MFEPPKDLKRQLAMFVNPATYCALRFTCRSFREALSDDHESYYRARVKHVSAFKPMPNVPMLSTYQKVLAKIIEAYNISDDFCRYVGSSTAVTELVLKTPSLLDKLFNTENGPRDIIHFLSRHPSCHKCVIHDSVIVRQFIETEKQWLTSFIDLICSDTQVYNSFLNSDNMMCAVAYVAAEYSDLCTYLCQCLKKSYHVEKRHTLAVKHLKTPRRELELCRDERREAIYSLLKNLRPVREKNDLGQRSSTALSASIPLAFIKGERQSEFPEKSVEKHQNNGPASVEGNNPLHRAIISQDIGLIKFYIRNASMEEPNNNGDFPIHLAVATGKSTIVKIVAAKVIEISRTNAEGWTALQIADATEKVEIAKILVDSGANLEKENISRCI